MKKTSRIKGFTLLELLIVISIIGILSSIIIFFVQDAKKRGADSGIKQDLALIKTQAALFLSENNNRYTTSIVGPSSSTCLVPLSAGSPYMLARDTAIHDAIAQAVKLSGRTTVSNNRYVYSYCYNSQNAWAVAVTLRSNANISWCVDHTGVSKSYPTALPQSSMWILGNTAGTCR